MGLRQKAKKSLEDQDLEEIEEVEEPEASEPTARRPKDGSAAVVKGLEADLGRARQINEVKDKEIGKQEKELAALRKALDESERERESLLKDSQIHLKEAEVALKSAERDYERAQTEIERLRGQVGKRQNLEEKDAALAAKLERATEREEKAEAQLKIGRAHV